MRILIDIPPATVDRLTAISSRRKQPRAAIIREALDQYAAAEAARTATDAFGLWHTDEDGLALQRRLREEW